MPQPPGGEFGLGPRATEIATTTPENKGIENANILPRQRMFFKIITRNIPPELFEREFKSTPAAYLDNLTPLTAHTKILNVLAGYARSLEPDLVARDYILR